MSQPLAAGSRARSRHVVSSRDTAASVGSGSLEVLATPILLAWMEAASCDATSEQLAVGETTVGSHVVLDHRRPTRIGGIVDVGATLVSVDGRRLTFEAHATDVDGTVIATASIVRVVVAVDNFAP